LAIRLIDLIKEERTVTVEFGNEKCDVVYQPGKLTPLVGQAMDEPGIVPVARLLSDVLLRWDLFDGEDSEGNPIRVSLDYDTIAGLPSEFLDAVQTTLLDDISASKKARRTSGDGSSPEERSARARRGTR